MNVVKNKKNIKKTYAEMLRYPFRHGKRSKDFDDDIFALILGACPAALGVTLDDGPASEDIGSDTFISITSALRLRDIEKIYKAKKAKTHNRTHQHKNGECKNIIETMHTHSTIVYNI